MNTRRLRHLALIYVAILVLNQSYFGIEHQVRASFENELLWVTFVPEGEEFTVTIPAWPTVRTYSLSSSYNPDHERILAHREYGGYGNGLVFIIQSYQAERPQRLWGDLLNYWDKTAVFERDISVDGVTARQYRSAYSTSYAKYTRHIVRFATKEHVYFLTLVTLEETNPVVDRFLSSLRLRRPEDRITPIAMQSSENIPGDVFSHSEVARRAIVVWKSEPTYTDEARAHGIIGNVILEAVFAANGYVTNITVTKEMKDGMTENAIEATRNIRFFPAEKDGKPVSQRMRLDYHFQLY
jgi:TonB family protein